MAKPKPTTNKNIAVLRARIAKGGDLNATTLSRSFGVPVEEVERILKLGGKS